MKHKTTIRRSAGLLVLLAGMGLAAGCSGGHGAHTTKFKEEAQERVSQIKAATQYDMALQQFLSGDLEKALRSIDQSIALSEKTAMSHVLRGRILIEQGILEGSLASFEKAVELDETSAEAPYYMGIVYERMSLFEKARDAYTVAYEKDPTNPQYLIAQAEMEIELGDIDKAREGLEGVRGSFAHNAGVRQMLGHIALIQGRQGDAVTLFQEASLLAPDDDSLIEDLARAQYAAGKFGEAEKNLRRLLADQARSDREDLTFLRAACLVSLDKPVEARDLLQGIVTGTGANNARAWVELGNIALLLEDWHRVRETGARAMALAPELADGYVLTAMWHREQGRPEEALKVLERSIGACRADATAPRLQGLIYQELGKNEEAVESFAIALERDPKDVDTAKLMRASEAASALAGAPIDGE